MRFHAGRPFRTSILLLFCLVAVTAGSAGAANRIFFIDANQSSVRIEPTSRLLIDLPAPVGLLTLPVVAQSDPLVSGGSVPGIGLSDGLETAIEGEMFLNLIEAGPTTNGLLGGSTSPDLIRLTDSGQYLPGDGTSAFDSDLAAEVGLPNFGLGTEFAMRGLSISTVDFGGLRFVTPDEFSFPVGNVITPAGITLGIADGVLMFSGLGFQGGSLFAEGNTRVLVPEDAGSLTRVGVDDWDLDLTFTTNIAVTSIAPVPISTDFDVTTTIHATTVPEPSIGFALAAGVLFISFAAHRRITTTRNMPLMSRIAMAIAILYLTPGCVDPTAFVTQATEDLNGDGEIDDLDIPPEYDESEGNGTTGSAFFDGLDLHIDVTGESPVSAACTGGSCPSVFTPLSLSASCGSAVARSDIKGFYTSFGDDCSSTSFYSATANATQFLFNQSPGPKVFTATLRTYATDVADMSITASAAGIPLTSGVPTQITVATPFSSNPIALSLTATYLADGPGVETAGASIEIESVRNSCINNRECGPGFDCVFDACRAEGVLALCQDHADCDAPLICNSSFRCVEPTQYPNSCNTPYECDGNCINNQCSEGLEFHPCNTSDDCDTSAPNCASSFCSTMP